MGIGDLPPVFLQQRVNEILRLLGHTVERVIVEVVFAERNIGHRVNFGVAHKRRQSRHQNVADDADAPHVRIIANLLKVDDFGGCTNREEQP